MVIRIKIEVYLLPQLGLDIIGITLISEKTYIVSKFFEITNYVRCRCLINHIKPEKDTKLSIITQYLKNMQSS